MIRNCDTSPRHPVERGLPPTPRRNEICSTVSGIAMPPDHCAARGLLSRRRVRVHDHRIRCS
jgi:hypothetical protein